MSIKETDRKIPVVDIFAGAGGLAEGFCPWNFGDKSAFDVRLAIEKNESAAATLKLRSFFRRSKGKSRNDYYAFLDGEFTLDQLYAAHREEEEAANAEVWQIDMGGEGFSEEELDWKIEKAIADRRDWVLVGGPPCQAFSTAGRARNKGKKDYDAAKDRRHFLYEEYLRIISRHWPAVFIMENVTGILSSKAGGSRAIFGKILEDLSDPGSVFQHRRRETRDRYHYRIFPLDPLSQAEPDLFVGEVFKRSRDFVVECEKYGIPQARHRVILLGVRDDIQMKPGRLKILEHSRVPVSAVLEGLPRLRSGLSKNRDNKKTWLDTIRSAIDTPWYTSLETGDEARVAAEIKRHVGKVTGPRYDRGEEHLKYSIKYALMEKKWPELHGIIADSNLKTLCHCTTREHMPEDIHRYLFVSAFGNIHKCSPRLRDFPSDLLPAHANVSKALSDGYFSDRFRVQLKHEPSTTIVSHLGNDGHYFIHHDPSQCRSLTVREAARLQTFPDNFFFCGCRGEQYRQVGNAVPPLLGVKIAQIVADILERSRNNAFSKKIVVRDNNRESVVL